MKLAALARPQAPACALFVLAATLARTCGRPVKYVEDRIDNIMACDNHGSYRVYDAELALERGAKRVVLVATGPEPPRSTPSGTGALSSAAVGPEFMQAIRAIGSRPITKGRKKEGII